MTVDDREQETREEDAGNGGPEGTTDPEPGTASAAGPPAGTPPEDARAEGSTLEVEGDRPPRSSTSPVGGVIGRFRVLKPLGSGSFGAVYLAEDAEFKRRKVALKLLRHELQGRPIVLQRMRREAHVLAAMNTPGICRLIDADLDFEQPWVALEYVEGTTLEREIADARKGARVESSQVSWHLGIDADEIEEDTLPAGPVGPDEALRRTRAEIRAIARRFADLARSLHSAHELGIVHRDIKPGNIMVRPDGRLVLLDFGMARADEFEVSVASQERPFLGTPEYMSPEQVDRRRADALSDIYALAAVLYEALCGLRPFHELPRGERLYDAIRHAAPASLRKLTSPGVDRDLELVIDKALQKAPEHRYPDAASLADDLERWLNHEPIRARPTPTSVRLRLWARREPAQAISLIASAAVMLLLIAALFLTDRLRERAEEGRRQAEEARGLEAEQRRIAQLRLAEVARLSDGRKVLEVLIEEEDLWPRRAFKIPQMEEWLRRAKELSARLPEHRRILSALEERLVPHDASVRSREAPLQADLFPGYEVRRRFASLQKRRAEEQIRRLEEQLSSAPTADEGELRARLEEWVAALAAAEDRIRELDSDPRRTQRLIFEVRARDSLTDELVDGTPGRGYVVDDLDTWRLRLMKELVTRTEELQELIPTVEERLAYARAIGPRSAGLRPGAWRRVIADLARRPGPYETMSGNPVQGPIIGLVPLGKDADSGLWEFAHLDTGPPAPWSGQPGWWARDDGDPTGKVDLSRLKAGEEGDFGLVFVLLPGGRFRMGATRDPQDPHHDPRAHEHEGPSHELVIDAFLLSKFEVTQGQWLRTAGENPAHYRAGIQPPIGPMITLRNPVASISWNDALEMCRRWDMVLPTESQWEYACRAGSPTAWWCGSEPSSIHEHQAGNIADLDFQQAGGSGDVAPWRDGHVCPAPVGSFAPNAFGIHDVIGNVWEWVEDGFDSRAYRRVSLAWRGERDLTLDTPFGRVYRGGSFFGGASRARSASRNWTGPTVRDVAIGFRPAMAFAMDRPLSPAFPEADERGR